MVPIVFLLHYSRSDGTAEDGLSETDKRIVMYRALTNPAYILHTSTDPILTCFHLYDELLCWSKVDIGSNKRYLDIADTLNEFLTGLLGTNIYIYFFFKSLFDYLCKVR